MRETTGTAQKMKLSIMNFFNECDQIRSPVDLVTFAEEILNEKLHFLCSVWVRIFCEIMYHKDLKFRTLVIWNKPFVPLRNNLYPTLSHHFVFPKNTKRTSFTEEKQTLEVFRKKRNTQKFCTYHRKISVLEYLLNEIADLKALTGAVTQECCLKKVLWKISKIYSETTLMSPFFSDVIDLNPQLY